MSNEPLMTIDDVAAHFGVPRATVYNWNHHGTGPRRVKVGRYVRYRRSDVEAWTTERYEDCQPI